MKVAFISFGGGALNRADSSSLGGSTSTIAPLAEMLTNDKHKVLWFGGRKDSHRTDGVQKRVKPQYDVIKEIMALFREAPQDRTFPGDHEISRSRYQVAWTVDRVRKYERLARLRIPDADAVWVNFMDVGLPNIACTLVLALTYLRRGTPVFLYDTDLRFRYRKNYGFPGNYGNKYRFSYERFLSPKQADLLTQLVILHQFRDVPVDPHFSKLETFYPIYDQRRELPIRDNPLWDVTYVGNDYMRRAWAERWYGHGALAPYNVRIIGKWDQTYYKQSPLKRVPLYPPIPQDKVESRLNNSLATVHLTALHYAALGHITTRTREATAAGCVIITPRDMTDADLFTAQSCILDTSQQIRDRLAKLRQYPEKRRRAVQIQRDKARKLSGLDVAYPKFLDLVGKYS